MQKQAIAQVRSAPRMRPFAPPSSRPPVANPKRALVASAVIVTILALVLTVATPEWGRALPALLITGTALPL